MPKTLAITISGAVSLGSYEAGVLYELLYALSCHNATVAPDQQIIIDVLTGASAGGMTAAIAAQKLLYDADALAHAYDNALYRPWVIDISLDALLKLRPGEDPTHALLSNAVVEGISQTYLLARYTNQVRSAPNRHPASAATIHLGLALANLNGLDYQRTLRRGDFQYTCYQDSMVRCLSEADDTRDIWETLRHAAVSCGAFPLAFHPVELLRHQSEYRHPFLVPFPSPSSPFTYTDGGTFQNEPLGLAKQLVDMIDPCHEHTATRFYLFVAPGARGSTASMLFKESTATLAATAKQITSAIFNQARFQDWIQAEAVNERIQQLDIRAEELMNLFLADPTVASQLQPGTAMLLPLLFTQDPSAINAARHRLQQQYAQEYHVLVSTTDTTTADIWIDAILTLESAADLGEKDDMDIYGITADDREFAGGQLEAFLGFFDQRYRDHDYDIGRTKAREFIRDVNAQGYPLGPIRYDPTVNPIRSIDTTLDGMTMANVPLDLRQRYAAQISRHIDKILLQMHMSWLKRTALEHFFITPQLHKLFEIT